MGEILYRGYASTGSMSSAYPPDQAINLIATAGKKCVYLTWTDPEDKTLSDGTIVKWYYTKIVRRTDRYPNDENDGVTVVLNSVRNQYQSNPYIDDGLESGVTYYYAAFACSTDESEVISTQGVNVSVTTPTYTTLTVMIDENDSNPNTRGSFAVDTDLSTPYGYNETSNTFWQEFFGYRPCLFKDGAVVGYLNPNDYNKFEDGTDADIKTGDSGDVMIEFPRRGLSISKNNSTGIITVSMTDNPNDSNFNYYAHMRGNTDVDAFYIGAYWGSVISNKFRSLSGILPDFTKMPETTRKYAKSLGENYGLYAFYQYTYIQAMYLLQFKGNTNSRASLGYSGSNADVVTGYDDTCGVMFGTPGAAGQLKLFGIERPWGNRYQYIDGIYIRSDGNIYTTRSDFDTATSGATWTNHGGYTGISTYIKSVRGTNELGFLPLSDGASNSTYWCDRTYISNGRIPLIGGSGGGMFTLEMSFSQSYNTSYLGRLMYL